jgi:hypothetical protein
MKPMLTDGNLNFLEKSLPSRARPAALVGALALTTAGLISCGGSGSGSAEVDNTEVTNPGGVALETGATAKVVVIPGGGGAVDALFPDGAANYSPDGYNLGGSGATIAAYGGNLRVLDIVAVASGVDALLSDGSVVFSPDGKNLGGGGASVQAYSGTPAVVGLTSVGDGVDVIFAAGGGVTYSPDGLNLGGGGTTARIYAGTDKVVQIVAMDTGTAVVTLFADGSAYYSPDNQSLGGGGQTVPATADNTVKRMVKVGGGVLAQFASGNVYLSPDGMNLAGGGHTIAVPSWDASLANAPFPARDSAHGAQFLGHLWISGGFSDPTNSDSCFATCSFFDLWSSTDADGTTWNSTPTFATATAPNPRDISPVINNGVMDAPVPTDFYDAYSPIIVWNGQLTAVGATVWRSGDGVSWARNNQADGVTAAPGPVPVRAGENSRTLVLGGTLFFLQPDSGEVYRSTDATASQWTDLGAIPNFVPRCGAAAFVLAGKMWIVGGGACDYSRLYNDIWSSPDGLTWSQNAQPAAWSGRMWACVATSSDGVAWLVGGYTPTDWNDAGGTVTLRYGANHADVWYSKDGSDWKQFKADVGSDLADDGRFEPRHAPTCFVGDAAPARFVVIAGKGGSDPNGGNARVSNSIRTLTLPAAASLP